MCTVLNLQYPILFKFQYHPGNQGDTTIVAGKPCSSTNCGHDITTILLDDLVEVIPFQSAIIKMDIQTYENKAFVFATKLLNDILIPYIFLEWDEMKKYYVSETHESPDKTLVLNLIKVLSDRSYHAYDTTLKNQLDINQWHTWPFDICWWRDVNKRF